MENKIKINDTVNLSIKMIDKKTYSIIEVDSHNNESTIITLNTTTIPTKLDSDRGKGKALFEALIPLLEPIELKENENTKKQAQKRLFREYKDKLDKLFNIKKHQYTTDKKEERDKQIKEQVTELDVEMSKKYPQRYDLFKARCEEYQYTPLEMVSKITQGLGVGLTIEVIRAYFGYFQTYCGMKGTNVIAVGGQSTGKTHILEQALELIPEEYVHRGVKSVAYFFRKYNHMDLTGHIFYLGDLGGENSDSNTIEMRDVLKQLSTDGYIERGLVDDNNDVEDQWVSGYPCITYSTVIEDMINEQERSRSMIITPPETEPRDLMYFKSTMSSPGEYLNTINQIITDKESTTGLAYNFNVNNEDYFFFNPYVFAVTEFMEDEEDFNRKIDEFNQILILCCRLNNGYKVTYTGVDEDFKDYSKPLYIASAEDNLNALKIFDKNGGLMPTEIKLAKGLIDNYKLLKLTQTGLTDNAYEEQIKLQYADIDIVSTNDDEEVKLTRDNMDNHLFTLTSLRKQYSKQRWYKANKENIPLKINRLYLNNILFKVGTNNDKETVYGVTHDAKDILTSSTVNFNDYKKKISEGKRLFHKTFPRVSEEFNDFMEDESKKWTTVKKANIFDVDGEDSIYDAPWINLPKKVTSK